LFRGPSTALNGSSGFGAAYGGGGDRAWIPRISQGFLHNDFSSGNPALGPVGRRGGPEACQGGAKIHGPGGTRAQKKRAAAVPRCPVGGFMVLAQFFRALASCGRAFGRGFSFPRVPTWGFLPGKGESVHGPAGLYFRRSPGEWAGWAGEGPFWRPWRWAPMRACFEAIFPLGPGGRY